MRICIICESPAYPSGFGVQARYLAEHLKKKHEVVLLCGRYEVPSYKSEGIVERRLQSIYDLPKVDTALQEISPDFVIVFWHLAAAAQYNRLRSAPANCPMVFWLAWESSTISPHMRGYFHNVPENHVVHLSEYARGIWKDGIKTKYVIPHAADTKIFRPLRVSQNELGRKWAMKLRMPIFDDSVILLNVDRNAQHKRWDCTFDYVRELKKAIPNRPVQLIAHCKGWGSDPNLQDLREVAKGYGVLEDVFFTGFDWGASLTPVEVNELYNLATFRISTSSGEGFGVPTIEAGFAGCPQIVTASTTLPEILGPDSPFLSPAAGYEYRQAALWAIPNVSDMVARTVRLLENGSERRVAVHNTILRMKRKFTLSAVMGQWDRLIEQVECSRETSRKKYRWGYFADVFYRASMQSLWGAIVKAIPDTSVLELGTWEGEFVRFGIEVGGDVLGVRYQGTPQWDDPKEYAHRITYCPLSKGLIPKDIYVLTDQLDFLAEEVGEEALPAVFESIAEACKWLIIRFEPTYLWGRKSLPSELGKKLLENAGFTRRFDIEKFVKDSYSHFTHEIWQVGNDTSKIPPGMMQGAK